MTRGIFAFLSLLMAVPASAGTGDIQKIGACPGDIAIVDSAVVPSVVKAIDPADLDQWLKILPNAKKPAAQAESSRWFSGVRDPATDQYTFPVGDYVTGNGAAAHVATATPPAANTAVSTPQAMVINGLAGFIQARVQAELQETAIEHMLNSLCGDGDSSAYFPKTCALKTGRDSSYLDLSHSYSALVIALRTDVRNIGACAVYIRQHSYLGYKIQSMFDQHEEGTPSDQLIYGLVSSGTDLNVTEDQAPNADDKTLLADPGNSKGPPACTVSAVVVTGKDGKPKQSPGLRYDGMCGVVIPLIAYTAVLEAQASMPRPGAAVDYKKLVTAYGLAFIDLISKNKVCDKADSRSCPLADTIATSLADLQSSDASMVAAGQKVTAVYRLGEDIETRMKSLPQASGDRTEIADQIMSMGNDMLGQFDLAVRVGLLDLQEQQELTSSIQLLSDYYGAYVAFEAKEYVIGVDKLGDALACLSIATSGCGLPDISSSDPGAASSVRPLSKAVTQLIKVGGAVASLAEAKSSDDFTNTLNELASPVNAWKIRHQENLDTIQAFAGFRLTGLEANNVPGFGTVKSRDYGEVLAPIGYAGSCYDCTMHLLFWSPHVGTWGYFISLIDVGNVLDQPRDVPFAGGAINGAVDNKFSNVVEPGIYLFNAPSSSWPLVIGVGYSLGPPDYRTVTYTPPYKGSTQGLASRRYAWGFFIAFDVPIYILN